MRLNYHFLGLAMAAIAIGQKNLCLLEEIYVVAELLPVVYTVAVTGHVPSNTTFQVAGVHPITVSNAPITIDTTVAITTISTAYVTVTNTLNAATTTTATAATTTSVDAETFALSIVVPASAKRKRQAAPSFMGPCGQLVSNANLAVDFSVINGTLQMAGQTASIVWPSQSDSLPVFAFSALPPADAISSTFATDGTSLIWTNPLFMNGTASYCLASQTLYVNPDQIQQSGCQTVDLVPISANVMAVLRAQDTMAVSDIASAQQCSSTTFSSSSSSSTPTSSTSIVHLTTITGTGSQSVQPAATSSSSSILTDVITDASSSSAPSPTSTVTSAVPVESSTIMSTSTVQTTSEASSTLEGSSTDAPTTSSSLFDTTADATPSPMSTTAIPQTTSSFTMETTPDATAAPVDTTTSSQATSSSVVETTPDDSTKTTVVTTTTPLLTSSSSDDPTTMITTTTQTSTTSINSIDQARSLIQANNYQSVCQRYLGYTTSLVYSTYVSSVTSVESSFAPGSTDTVDVTPTITIETTLTPTDVITITATLTITDVLAVLNRRTQDTNTITGIILPDALATFDSMDLSTACSFEAPMITDASTIFATDTTTVVSTDVSLVPTTITISDVTVTEIATITADPVVSFTTVAATATIIDDQPVDTYDLILYRDDSFTNPDTNSFRSSTVCYNVDHNDYYNYAYSTTQMYCYFYSNFDCGGDVGFISFPQDGPVTFRYADEGLSSWKCMPW